MSAVLASEKDVLALLAACGTPERTGIAAVNGSTQTVLSGPLEDLARIADKAGSLGISIRHLPVSHAFHSSLMDPILDDFARVAESIAYDAPGWSGLPRSPGPTTGCGISAPPCAFSTASARCGTWLPRPGWSWARPAC